ncbi:MAG: dipeptide epimerase [Bacteroidales bacterium]|nr:dipeptide epimerase [Bacteroidales bacterium]
MTLSFCQYPLNLKHTFTVATCSRTTTPDVLVSICYDGVIGYGEASMPPYLGESIESVCRFLSRIDLSPFADPMQTDAILQYVDSVDVGNCAAKAAIDIALHDLQGKMTGQTVRRMLTGRDDAQLMAGREPLPTTYTIGIDTEEKVQQKVLEVAGRFRRLKIKVGVPGDHALVQAIRRVTDLPLTVDANQGWSDPHKALDEIEWLAEQGCIMVEQPLPKGALRDHAWLTARSPLPIIADESVQRLVDLPRLADSFSGINIKLMKCTGLHEAYLMIQEAQRLHLKVMLGCMTETSCAVSAAAQLASFADFADLDGNLLIANDPFTGMQIVDGYIQLNDKPGIGVEPIAPIPFPLQECSNSL